MHNDKISVIIGARAGSQRVKNKNTRILNGKPLIVYTIEQAIALNKISDIFVSSNDPDVKEICSEFDEVTFIQRPDKISTHVSKDIEYIKHILESFSFDIFVKLNPTSPFREVSFIEKNLEKFISNDKYDSARAVQLCKEHPGKMWTIDDDDYLNPLDLNLKFDYEMHEAQYQDLPNVYIQTSSLEIANVAKISKFGNRSGKTVMPILCDGVNSFSIDYEFEFDMAEKYLSGELNLS